MTQHRGLQAEAAPVAVSDAETFIHLSKVLTGEPFLASDLACLHLARLRADPDANAKLGALLGTFAHQAQKPRFDEERFRREIVLDPEILPLVRRIAILWFVGALPKLDWETKPETALDYGEQDPRLVCGALMWPAIGAHPPGLPAGCLGHQRRPPEH